MSETKNLRLFKHNEPLETNENKFDIDLALNQNWDKIEEFAGMVNDKVIELEDKDEEQDFNLQELQNEIKKDRENMINLETEGQSIHIEDSSDLEGKLEVLGNVEQDVREGYNLLENILTDKTVNGITVKINKDKSIILNGTATSNTSLDITGNFAITEQSVFSGMCDGYGYNKMLIQIQGSDYNVNIPNSTPQVLQPKDNVKVRIYIYAGTNMTNAMIKPQINKGTVAKPYEQYGVSPSPEYPSEIRAVGDNINLLEITAKTQTVNGVTFTVNEDGTVIANGTATSLAQISLVANVKLPAGTYTIKDGKAYVESTEFNDWFDGLNNPSTLTFNTEVLLKNVYIQVKQGETVNNKIFYPKLEKGTEATSYSKFGQGSVEIKKQNKNLAPKLKDGKLEKQNTFICNCKKGESFTLSTKGTAEKDGRLFLRTNTDFAKETDSYAEQKEITLNGTEQKITITSTIDGFLYIRTGGAAHVYNFTYLQIEKGTVATEYIEHQEQTKILPIQKPMLEGDDFINEVDGWKERHKWKKIILNGQENTWQLYENGTRRFGLDLTKDLPLKETRKYVQGYCTHFEVATTMNINLTMFLQVEIGHFYIGIVDKNSKWADVNALKSELQRLYNAGTPVILYYKVETPTKLPCTPEQTKILDELDNFQTYKPVTNITTDNIAKLKLKYIADTKTYIDNKTSNLEQQVNTINQLLSTTKTSAKLLDNLQSDIESEVL